VKQKTEMEEWIQGPGFLQEFQKKKRKEDVGDEVGSQLVLFFFYHAGGFWGKDHLVASVGSL